jgi:ligand-binding SRPBCC domain-containing protein
MLYQIRKSQQLSCNIETAWNFFSSPENLTFITPGDMRFVMHTQTGKDSIYEGMEIEYSVSPLFHIPVHWKTKITHVTFQKHFVDVQEKGPFRQWHHQHEFIENEYGVLMKDTVNYQLPLGFLGRIVHRFFVKRRLEYIFNYRYKIVNQLFVN